MLSGLYSYVFGNENGQEGEECGVCMRTRADEGEEGWMMVQESPSGRSSPTFVHSPSIEEIDNISFASLRRTTVSSSSIKKTEELREARAANKMRLHLEKAMFSAVPLESASKSECGSSSKSSAARIKRATASTLVASDSKTKNRSKKSAKMHSGANNNRKCNNVA